LDLSSTAVLFLATVFLGMVLAGIVGSQALGVDGSLDSPLVCYSSVVLFVLVVICVPVLSFLFKREEV
jgi:hypothetical protein